MINVSINSVSLSYLLDDGYILEHDKNMLTIRNMENKPLAEIIYFEKTNEILIITEKEFVWCDKINDIICCDNNAVYICYCRIFYSYQYDGTIEARNK